MPENSRKSIHQGLIEEDEAAGWITTYADLVTLLLVFFVLLFSISSLDLQRFQAIAVELQKSFGNPSATIPLIAPDVDKAPEIPQKHELDIVHDIPVEVLEELDQKLLSDVKEFVEKKRVGDNIVVTQEKNRITIMVEGQVLFDSGRAELVSGALPLLDDIAVIIGNHPQYRVNIKGHTDNVPIATAQFPSNWELSAVRATTVLRYLVDHGIGPPGRLTATGYGDLLPVASNDTPEGRARNRRVEFVLEKEKQDRKS
jgi:chemotaxis protein MotB